MIKRFSNQEKKKELAVELGMDASAAVADYDESSDSSSSDDDSDDDSSSDEEEEEVEAPAPAAKKAGKQAKKEYAVPAATKKALGKRKQPETDESESDSSDSDSDSDDDQESSSGEEESSDDETKNLPPMSASKAMEDPIYIADGAPFSHDFQRRTCILCPTKPLKTEKAVNLHVTSKVSSSRPCRTFIKRLANTCYSFAGTWAGSEAFWSICAEDRRRREDGLLRQGHDRPAASGRRDRGRAREGPSCGGAGEDGEWAHRSLSLDARG